MKDPDASDRRSRGRRWALVLAVLLLVVLLVRLFREPLLRAIGDHLITDEAPVHVDAVYVLGGGAFDRGREAVRMYQLGICDRFVFTGADPVSDLSIYGLDVKGCELARQVALRNGMPETSATVLPKGTSTVEEADALLQLAEAEGVDTVMILTDRLHLRRVRRVFRERFRKAGITVVLHGTRSSFYDEERWWESEKGLLMVNNEYVKLLYYMLKY
ncbi:MAG TPA: ElyC/SanA/YdcF family protein [Flavobacteriales bacterium]